MNRRILASLGASILLAASRAPAQDIAQNIKQDMNHDEGGGGCVYNREVYSQGAEICQAGALMRCDEGSWDELGACSGDIGQEPNSEGGDETASDD